MNGSFLSAAIVTTLAGMWFRLIFKKAERESKSKSISLPTRQNEWE
jgi:hypothetical protein